jgi:hypothetical protein
MLLKIGLCWACSSPRYVTSLWPYLLFVNLMATLFLKQRRLTAAKTTPHNSTVVHITIDVRCKCTTRLATLLRHLLMFLWTAMTELIVIGLKGDLLLLSRVAIWYNFKLIILMWVNFRGPLNGKGWYILWTLWNILWLVCNFMAIWFLVPIRYISHRFGKLCKEKSGNPAYVGFFFSLYGDQWYCSP